MWSTMSSVSPGARGGAGDCGGDGGGGGGDLGWGGKLGGNMSLSKQTHRNVHDGQVEFAFPYGAYMNPTAVVVGIMPSTSFGL